MCIINNKIDFLFIKFPIIFPLIYLCILYFVPSLEVYLIFFTLLLLAEPHFGATWPIFLDIKNKDQIKNNKYSLIIGPLLIILFSLIGFFFFKYLFLIIFYGFNVYHVTKQSVGISKLYTKDIKEKTYQEYSIYLLNIIFFLIGLFRFYLQIISENYLFMLSIVSLSFLLLIAIIQYFIFKNFSNAVVTLTGMLIFFPICFVVNPVHAIILGVTMHYSQYITITGKVFFGRENLLDEIKKNKLSIINSKFFIFIFTYGLVMTFLSAVVKFDAEILKNLIIVPIIGQILHFYIDGFIWKFSEKHNRDITLKHIYT